MNNVDIAVNLVEMKYMEQMKEKLLLDDDISNFELRERLFPDEWYDLDGKTKLRALKEALDNNILLSDTVCFNKSCEEKHGLIRSLLIRFICGNKDDE